MTPRNEAIKAYYAKCGNMAETGRFFNLSRERIRQIVKGRTKLSTPMTHDEVDMQLAKYRM